MSRKNKTESAEVIDRDSPEEQLFQVVLSAYGSGFYDGHCGGCTDEYCEMYYMEEDAREDLKDKLAEIREIIKKVKEPK